MTGLTVIPQALSDAAGGVAAIGTSLSDANAAAAAPTTSILPAGADEVSAAIAELFGAHGVVWQELAAQAQLVQERFAELLAAAGQVYQGVEDANAQAMLQHGFTTAPDGTITILPQLVRPVGQGIDVLSAQWGGQVFDALNAVVKGVITGITP